jgi:NHL repeat-containing protein
LIFFELASEAMNYSLKPLLLMWHLIYGLQTINIIIFLGFQSLSVLAKMQIWFWVSRVLHLDRTRSPTASSLNQPSGIAFDHSGNLWVGDSGNNRILRYSVSFFSPPPDQQATKVLGKQNFTSERSALDICPVSKIVTIAGAMVFQQQSFAQESESGASRVNSKHLTIKDVTQNRYVCRSCFAPWTMY